MLAAWGRVAHRYRWAVLLLSLVPLAPAAWLLRAETALEPTVRPPSIEAVRAVELMDRELPGQPPTISFIFGHASLRVTDPPFRAAVERALAPLRNDQRVARIRTAWDRVPPDPARISRDGHRTHAVVELRGRAPAFASMTFGAMPPGLYEAIRGQVRSETLDVVAVGIAAMNHDFTRVAREDLRTSELVVLPLVLALLLLVFGSVVAAALPLLVGLLSVAIGLAGTVLLGTVTPVSAYASNVVSMVGLGVAIDYSLFLVSRYREELPRHPPAEALARTLVTTGRAVVFSGLTVGIGLTSLLLLRTDTISSMGVAGMIVVLTAVLYTLTFLPALLAILGPRVNALRVPLVHPERTARHPGSIGAGRHISSFHRALRLRRWQPNANARRPISQNLAICRHRHLRHRRAQQAHLHPAGSLAQRPGPQPHHPAPAGHRDWLQLQLRAGGGGLREALGPLRRRHHSI